MKLQEKRQPTGSILPGNAYLRCVEEIYQSDAYHSLSIEGYRVTPELTERVRVGNWNPADDEADWRMAQPMQPRKAQKPCDVGLFDTESRRQMELS